MGKLHLAKLARWVGALALVIAGDGAGRKNEHRRLCEAGGDTRKVPRVPEFKIAVKQLLRLSV